VWFATEWIGHGHATPCKTVLQILREYKSAAGIRRHGQHHRVPDSHMVSVDKSRASTMTLAEVSLTE
jgi:hypothetical protein